MIRREFIVESIAKKLPYQLASRLIFFIENGYYPDVRRPRTFNEKSLRTKMSPPPLICFLADKLEARRYAIHLLGEAYVPALYFSSTRMTIENFESLPSRFVLKANHGWGYTKVVNSKSDSSFAELFSTSEKWLAEDYSITRNLERQYKTISRRVYAEQNLGLCEEVPVDYKFHVFRNSPHAVENLLIEIHVKRFTDHQIRLMSSSWQEIDLQISGGRVADRIKRPKSLTDMLRVSEILSRPFPYCRVDLYEFGGEPKFGEITFTPSGGHEKFNPRETDSTWGAFTGNRTSCFF